VSDFFDEKHWWNQKAERDVKVPFPAVIWKHGPGLTWCPFHNYYYTTADGQTYLRCDEERAKRGRRAPQPTAVRRPDGISETS